MATLDQRYTINGLVDTSRTALDNLTAITNSCNTWLSYDALEGKWAVVINRAGDAAFNFDDSNIVGPINLTTTALNGYYNSCEVRFHNFTLRDREDFVLLETPTNQRLPNEPDNRLIINAPMVNNQIQAELLGLIELKQSRLDKVIEFTTDFSYVNIEAGTIITVTNEVYGWTDKLFRVLTVSEQQTELAIAIQITAQEYDADIYSDEDLYLYLRETEDGLIELDPLVDVSPVTENTQVVDDAGAISPLLLALPALLALLDGFFDGDDSQTMQNRIFTEAGGGTYVKSAFLGPNTGLPNTFGGYYIDAEGKQIARGLYTQFNDGTFVAPQTGSYILTSFINYGSQASGPSELQLFKNGIVTLRPTAYYSGFLGIITDDLFDGAAAIVENATEFDLNAQPGTDQYSQMTLIFSTNLVAGTTYYINSFFCVETPIDTISRRAINIQYAG